METTVPLPFLASVDLTSGAQAEASETGLTSQQLEYLGCAFLTATVDNTDNILTFLQQHLALQTYVDVSKVTDEDVTSILDAGARTVFVHPKQIDTFKAYGDRIAVAQDGVSPTNTAEGGYLLKASDLIDTKASIETCIAMKIFPVFFPVTRNAHTHAYLDLARETGAVPLFPASLLSMASPTMSSTSNDSSVAAIIASSWTSDRSDGLIPTLVTNESGIAMGLVYSSQESLSESFKTGTGVYQSRKRGLWYKGATSGDVQELVRVSLDCDQDCLKFVVRQKGRGFCHLPQSTCFGEYRGIAKLEKTLQSRKISAPQGSYTARLFSDEKLLRAKLMEEAEELCDAKTKDEVAFEAADVIYFALTKAVSAGVTLADIERNLDAKSVKIKRRQGDAKGKWAEKEGITNGSNGVNGTNGTNGVNGTKTNGVSKETLDEAANVPKAKDDPAGTKNGRITMKRYNAAETSPEKLQELLQRPSQRSTEMIMGVVNPIIKEVRTRGDAALLEYTHKFEKATSLTSAVLKAPFPQHLMDLPQETIEAIDISFENIRKFHAAQKEDKPLQVETMPGIVCSRFVRPIERVGLYVPGGTAVLPSTALMLGVPAMVAGCKKIVMASPPRSDGSITPEIVYVAHKVGAESIVLAGGAQAVAAMAYGTESVTKVDKILGPGNQFVTAAKMFVSNDTNAGVSIDMPAGPSEVLVVADKDAVPAFVASDLLSQAEHGVDSQVILIAIDLSESQLQAIEDELHNQAIALPRVDIVRGAIEHSVTLNVRNVKEAFDLSNEYAPEHLILQMKDAQKAVELVENAGSIFIGQWTPESVGDYSAGVNHSLPTYGYAKQYSGVNLASYVKHITSSNLTAEGLKNVGGAVMQLAKVEQLEAHRRAVEIRLKWMSENGV